MNDVKLNGFFTADIVVNGQYTNIKEIDMSDFSQGNGVKAERVNNSEQKPVSSSVSSDEKQKSIEAQAITKVIIDTMPEGSSDEDAQVYATKCVELFHYVKKII